MTALTGVDSNPIQGPGSPEPIDADDRIGDADAGALTSDALDRPDEDAGLVAQTLLASQPVDTVQGPAPATTDARPADTVKGPTAVAPTERSPGLLESGATWVGQTLKGYATGAVNTILDAANLSNLAANGVLSAAGIDHRFRTDLGIAPTSESERHAQNAITAGSVVLGVAGVAKGVPRIAGSIDDAIRGGAPRAAPAVPGAVGAGARLGDLTPNEIARIQAAADRFGNDIYVVGSAAKGARRNVGTDLPLGQFGRAKNGTRSDIDYAVRNGLDDHPALRGLPDVDPSFGVRGVDYLNLPNSPAIRFSPGRPPTLIRGDHPLTL